MTDFQKGALVGAVMVLLPIGYGLFLSWLEHAARRIEAEREDGPVPGRRAGL